MDWSKKINVLLVGLLFASSCSESSYGVFIYTSSQNTYTNRLDSAFVTNDTQPDSSKILEKQNFLDVNKHYEIHTPRTKSDSIIKKNVMNESEFSNSNIYNSDTSSNEDEIIINHPTEIKDTIVNSFNSNQLIDQIHQKIIIDSVITIDSIVKTTYIQDTVRNIVYKDSVLNDTILSDINTKTIVVDSIYNIKYHYNTIAYLDEKIIVDSTTLFTDSITTFPEADTLKNMMDTTFHTDESIHLNIQDSTSIINSKAPLQLKDSIVLSHIIDTLVVYDTITVQQIIPPKDSLKSVNNEMKYQLENTIFFEKGLMYVGDIDSMLFQVKENYLVNKNDILIKGYSDKFGSEEINFKMSQKRIDLVKIKMLNLGIPLTKIHSQNLGESLSQNEHDVNERKVEIYILK